jgi:hypothetical protein
MTRAAPPNTMRQARFPWTYDVTQGAIQAAFFDLADAFARVFARRKPWRM